MEDEDIAQNIHIQLIHSEWAESHACTLYWKVVYWRDFLPTQTGSAVYIWRNILGFQFEGSSIYNLFIYEEDSQKGSQED